MLFHIKNATYDDVNGIVKRKGNEYKLTKTQQNLLNFLIQHPKTVHSKQTLMEKVWNRIVTENSVDQMISFLRNYLEENPSKPQIIVTHFGKGISFEVPIEEVKVSPIDKQNNTSQAKVVVIVVLILASLGYLYYWNTHPEKKPTLDQSIVFNNTKKLLILPTKFSDQSIDSVKQKGIQSLMQSTFNNLDNEGQLIFDTTSLTTQQAIEKHWQLEKDLIVLRANIIKNGDIYESIIEFDDGLNKHQEKHLKAKSIDNLMENQMAYIANLNTSKQAQNKEKHAFSSSESYIKALGYQKLGELKKAKKLLQEVLFKDENNHQARLTLAEILFQEKNFDESLSQLNTLKETSAYQTMGTEIELGIAKNNLAKKNDQQVIDNLTDFQAQHTNISEVKKAKIMLLLADAHRGLVHQKIALKFYKQAIAKVDALLNPMLFAMSYYGQAEILLKSTINQDVYALYQKAYDNALLAKNIPFQIKALNKMSFISMNNYDWDNAIKLTNQVISLHELGTDKNSLGMALGNLVAIFNLRGEFTQAQDVNERLGKIAKETQSDTLQLHYLHYKAVLTMNHFDWITAQQIISEQLQLAKKTKDFGMQLNNAFLQLELILLKKDPDNFMPEWDKRVAEIKALGFERYQIYMDLYLARYYALIANDKKAINLYKNVSERALQSEDIKIYVDAQTRLAKVLLKTDVDATLKLLNNLEQYNPHPNPYLDLKAQVLHKLGKNIEALSLLNQAKLVYHESWTAENQALLESIKTEIK